MPLSQNGAKANGQVYSKPRSSSRRSNRKSGRK